MNSEIQTFIFFSELLGRTVPDESGRSLGRLADVAVVLDEFFPNVERVVLKSRWRGYWELDWKHILHLDGHALIAKREAAENLRPLAANPAQVLLRDEVLDKQVVDTFGSKIERANDIHFLINKGELRLVHVDVGFRGILRRLGWTKMVDAATQWLFSYVLPDRMVSWKYIQPLASDPEKKRLKLNVAARGLKDLDPADLADIIEELDRKKREHVFHTLDVEIQADALEELKPEYQKLLIESLSEEQASNVIEEMQPDEAVDLLLDLPKETQKEIIEKVQPETRRELTELLTFKEGTAGSLMTSRYLSIGLEATVQEAMENFRAHHKEVASNYYTYVVDADKKLLGVFSLRDLLLHPPEAKIGDLMNKHPKKVKLKDSNKKVGRLFIKYNFLAVPVVDKKNVLAGIVTLKDALEAVLPDVAKQ
ncbi:MAG: CBS domain-containing protein [candidate division Zixibacteria bacterium]|nr:CBS domain-containing protein [candidate division Zixibacteria bacterium]